MTNAEYYLKEGIDCGEFVTEFEKFALSKPEWEHLSKRGLLALFLEKQRKPILTEDERVILRNMIPQVKTIGRDTDGELIIKICSDTIAGDFCYSGAFIYDHLFQFIKERRRI